MNKKIDSNSVSLAGEFAVLSQLTLHGYDANMTLGHTKGVDILVSNPKTSDMFRVEVKTNHRALVDGKFSKSTNFGDIVNNWLMNIKHELITDPKLYYCFVEIDKNNNFSFYVVPSKVVAKYIKDEGNLWFSIKKRNKTKTSDMRNFRLGLKGHEYQIETPFKEDYENNWNFTN